MNDASVYVAFGAAIAIVLVGLGLGLLALQLVERLRVENRRARTFDLMMRFKTSPEYLTTLEEVRTVFQLEGSVRVELLEDEQIDALDYLLDVYESLGLGVREGLLDSDVVNRLQGELIIKLQTVTADYVASARRERRDPYVWAHFERLAHLLRSAAQA